MAPLVVVAAIAGGAMAQAQAPMTLHDKPRPLPEIGFTGAGGRALGLADFRGMVVLLNLWATWCLPCRREMPMLDRLQAKLGGAEFEVVALSIDRSDIMIVEAFYDELDLKHMKIYHDPSGKAARALGLIGLPTTLLVDRQGRELGRLVGPAEWDSPETVALIRRYLDAKDDTPKRSSIPSPAPEHAARAARVDPQKPFAD
ncbi:MAG: TlpA family protein disulfide reductase [Pseudomonadota bacterium]